MTAAITLAKSDDLDRLEGLVMLCHQETGIDAPPAQRREGLSHVLANSPHAAAYLIGPVRAPVGYVMLSFGWSLELLGHYCTIDQIYVRSGVRGRGIASEVMTKLTSMLKSTDIKSIQIHATQENVSSKRLFKRAHFRSGRTFTVMLRDL